MRARDRRRKEIYIERKKEKRRERMRYRDVINGIHRLKRLEDLKQI